VIREISPQKKEKTPKKLVFEKAVCNKGINRPLLLTQKGRS
jgi:hypothetical protein